MCSPAVIVHTGAGEYPDSELPSYRNLINSACNRGVDLLKLEENATEVCVKVCALIEDSPLTNAGVGSNLNYEGKIELDAMIMRSDDGNYGAVGALPGFKNPILIAAKLVELQSVKSPFIPPCFLVGSVASNWCQRNGFAPSDCLMTDESLKSYSEALKCVEYKLKQKHSEGSTVGVVVVDQEGEVCAATSSGGILLKEPGRVGSSAVYGAGCWAEELGSAAVGVSASGTGELLIRTQYSSSLSRELLHNLDLPLCPSAEKAHRNSFSDSKHVKNFGKSNLGASFICIRCDINNGTEVCYGSDNYRFAISFASLRRKPYFSLLKPSKSTLRIEGASLFD